MIRVGVLYAGWANRRGGAWSRGEGVGLRLETSAQPGEGKHIPDTPPLKRCCTYICTVHTYSWCTLCRGNSAERHALAVGGEALSWVSRATPPDKIGLAPHPSPPLGVALSLDLHPCMPDHIFPTPLSPTRCPCPLPPSLPSQLPHTISSSTPSPTPPSGLSALQWRPATRGGIQMCAHCGAQATLLHPVRRPQTQPQAAPAQESPPSRPPPQTTFAPTATATAATVQDLMPSPTAATPRHGHDRRATAQTR